MTDPTNPEVIILNAALELPASERRDYIEKACAGNEALRQQVEGLIRAHEQAEGFMEAPPAGLDFKRTVLGSVLTEKPGDKIGRYKLLQQIGEGGCGVVYMAEQEEPVRRRVALKVIKLGMDTKQVIARFEAERQALALMDHPNIAKVLEAGATDTGRPYFVMELVRGIRITEFCDENKLSTPDRLKLFIQVCQAIQHAHQKGVIHRDIKPSNILVTINDGVPVPKVIDFGIAKATQGRLTNHTFFTAFEQFIGTPAYMSPEQAVMTSLDIDTRSDIYSLGVLLYELLTGKTPFDQEELLAAGLDEMRRTIREKEPLRPSTRLGTMGADALTTTAKHRHTDAPRLIHLLHGDLDWIVMKSLDKDRARRYETANGLAMDIERHLHDEPVTARPPSALYRLQKSVRRNKTAFAAATAIAAVLVIGVVVSTCQAVRATRAEREQTRLRQQAEEARVRAETNEKKATTEAIKSQQVAQFLKDMLTSVGPSVAVGRDTTILREVLDRTVERVGRDLKGQPEVEGELLDVSGEAYEVIRESAKAEAAFRNALVVQRKALGNIHPAVADSLFGLAQTLQEEAKPAESEALFRESLEIRRKVYGNEHRRVADCLNNITGPLVAQGKLAEAEAFGREALAMKRKLLGDYNHDVAISLRDLGLILGAEGKLAEEEGLLSEGLAIFRRTLGDVHIEVAFTLSGLASTLSAEGKLAEAETAYREALAIRRKLYDNKSRTVADTLNSFTDVLQREGKLAEAEELINGLLAQAADSKSECAKWLCARGELRARAGLWNEAMVEFSKAADLNPNDEESSANLVLVLLKMGRNEECRQLCHQLLAQAVANKSVARGPAALAKALLLLSADGPDFERACELADFGATVGNVGRFSSTTKALAEYRRGRFDSAKDWAWDVISKNAADPSRWASAWFTQALAYARLQQIELARTALARGNELVNPSTRNSTQDSSTSWRDWIVAELLGQEASELIEGQTNTAAEKKPEPH